MSALRVYADNFADIFTLGKQLGAGQFGTAYVCTEKATGHTYACKSLSKAKLLTMSDVEDVRREVAILYHVQVSAWLVNRCVRINCNELFQRRSFI